MLQNTTIKEEVSRYCIGVESYRGYRSTFIGDGVIQFVGPGGDIVKGHSVLQTGWVEPAWEHAKSAIDQRLSGVPK